MSKKYLMICLTIAFAICVSVYPVIAGEDTYQVNIEGVNFNIPNDYHLKEDFIFEEDVISQDRWGNGVPVHYKSVDYTNGKNSISITVTTSNGEPFDLKNVAFADDAKTTIANKTGAISKSPGDVLFSYVEDGKIVGIETFMDNDNVNIIEKVIGS